MKSRIVHTEPPAEHPSAPLPPAELRGPDPSADPHAAGPPVAGLRGVVRRHPLVTFFVLSYAIGWMFLPWGGFLPFSPLVAALVVVPITRGRAGLRELGSRMIRWRVSWYWYAAAIAVPLGVNAATTGLNLALGAPAISTGQFHPWFAVITVFAASMVDPTGGPLGEEPGWRGMAVPALQERRSPLASALILSVLVAGWHAPLVFMSQFDLRPQELVTTMAVTFWYAWLFNRTGGSVLLTLIAHSAEGSVDLQSLWPSSGDGSRLSWCWLVVWGSVALALVVFDRAAWRTEESPGERVADVLDPARAQAQDARAVGGDGQ